MDFYSTKVGTLWSVLYFYCNWQVPAKKKKKTQHGSGREWESFFRDWNGMGFSPSFFRGIGTGQDFFLWDGRGLKIHSRVTLWVWRFVDQASLVVVATNVFVAYIFCIYIYIYIYIYHMSQIHFWIVFVFLTYIWKKCIWNHKWNPYYVLFLCFFYVYLSWTYEKHKQLHICTYIWHICYVHILKTSLYVDFNIYIYIYIYIQYIYIYR